MLVNCCALRGDLQLSHHRAAGLGHVLLQLLLDRLACRIVHIDQRDFLQAPLLHDVGAITRISRLTSGITFQK